MLFLIWMVAQQQEEAGFYPLLTPGVGAGIFLLGFVLLVVLMGLWGRRVARGTGWETQRRLARFQRLMFQARVLIPLWFTFGIFALRWYEAVAGAAGALARWQSLYLLIGISPALLAWMGLWWSQYPAERALREQNLLAQLNDDLPLHAAPSFWSFFAANLRLQLLFTIVPVLLILLLRDLAAASLRPLGLHLEAHEELEALVNLSATACIFILAPQILRYVLHTQRLPESDLRQRLEAMCRKFGLKYRDILLWHTQNNMGNAAVVGIVPRLRYVLLSDLLLETMNDRQIEAVFAHELGHIVHRHMIWYVLFFLTMTLAIGGPGAYLASGVQHLLHDHLAGMIGAAEIARLMPWLMLAAGVGAFLLVFGYLSRCFERQADVFAARTLQAELSPPATDRAPVGREGAAVFSSALERVALVNNIPVQAPSWCHGSIARRMSYLYHLGEDPSRTSRFDRLMRRVYAALLFGLFACTGFVALGW